MENCFGYPQCGPVSTRDCRLCGEASSKTTTATTTTATTATTTCPSRDRMKTLLCRDGGIKTTTRSVSSCTNLVTVSTSVKRAMDRPVSAPTGFEKHQGYKDAIARNQDEVKDYDKCGDDYRIVNRSMDEGFSYRRIEELLEWIQCEQNDTFQLNIGFGFILHNPKTEGFKYFFDSRNHMLYEKPVTIRHSQDLDRFVAEIKSFDLKKKYYLDLTPNEWILAGFTNVQINISFGDKKEEIPDTTTKRRGSVVRPINRLKRKNSGSINHLNASNSVNPKNQINRLKFNPSSSSVQNSCNSTPSQDSFLYVCIYSDNQDNSTSKEILNLGQGLLQTCLVR